MKGIVIYRSKYGATKRYADWLAEETGFDCRDVRRTDIEDVKKYDVVVFGGGIYAARIGGLSFLKKHLRELAGKKILVFCVGASPYDPDAFAGIRVHAMKDELADIPLFYCRGAWNMSILSPVDRSLCKMLQKSVAKKDPSERAVWEQALMEAGSDVCDWTNKACLEPILAAIRED